MAALSHKETLIEERVDEMVPLSGGKSTRRLAHFLKGKAAQSQQSAQNPPILFNNINSTKPNSSNLKSFSSNIHFQGWRYPQKKWSCWVEKLRPSFEPIWKKASIFEPIMASTLEIPRCNDTLLALAQRWCPETNSVVLPWGEVTITLQDILLLGGYSLTGDSVLTELKSKELIEIEDKLDKQRSEIAKSKHKRSSCCPWMDIWMDKGKELEHEAFLTYWLSRYVLPAHCYDTINKGVFPIAVLLARGTQIALAPSLLASIYRDFRLLKAHIGTFGDHDCPKENKPKLKAPLQLFQVWAWERFPTLSPEPKVLSHGLPRVAWWDKVRILRQDDVGLAIDSAKETFRWRPYTIPLNNWSCRAMLYPEMSGWVSVGSESGLDLDSYARCIRVGELVGLDSVQQYLPHRVSMHFGLDQDIPLDVPWEITTCEIAWSCYNRPIGDVKVYVPSRHFESDVTTRYLDWWESNFEKQTGSCVKKDDVNPTVNRSGMNSAVNYYNGSLELAQRMSVKMENNEANVPPGFDSFDPNRKREVISESSDQPSSKRLKGSPGALGIRRESNVAKTSCSSSQVKGVASDDDSDLDHLTLSQLFQRNPTSSHVRVNTSGAISPSQSESPRPYTRDNVAKLTSSPPPMSSNEKELGRSLDDIPQPAEDDLEAQASRTKSTKLGLQDRISRLDRTVRFFLPFIQGVKNSTQ